MYKFYSALISLILFGSCSSSRLIDQYTSPDSSRFRAKKVLVIGMAPDGGLQKQFEFSLVEALKKQNFDAVKSVDFFGEDIVGSEKYGNELESLKDDLLNAGFDAVFFSRITGRNTKVTLAQSYRNLVKTFEVFGEYSKSSPTIYESGEFEDNPILHTETLYYCLCPEMENDLIWKGNIDIVNASTSEEAIQDYVKILLRALKKNNLLPSN